MKKLLGQTRLSILQFLLSDTPHDYYFNEIARNLGRKPGAIQRTLNSLVDEGTLTSYRQANARFFKINQDYPYLAEIKGMAFKTADIGMSVTVFLSRLYNIRCAFLYEERHGVPPWEVVQSTIVVIGSDHNEARIRAGLKERIKLNSKKIKLEYMTPAAFRGRKMKKDPLIMKWLGSNHRILHGDLRHL